MKTSSVSIAMQSLPVTTSPRRRRCVTSTSLAITLFGCLTRRSPDATVRTSATGSPENEHQWMLRARRQRRRRDVGRRHRDLAAVAKERAQWNLARETAGAVQQEDREHLEVGSIEYAGLEPIGCRKSI